MIEYGRTDPGWGVINRSCRTMLEVCPDTLPKPPNRILGRRAGRLGPMLRTGGPSTASCIRFMLLRKGAI